MFVGLMRRCTMDNEDRKCIASGKNLLLEAGAPQTPVGLLWG